MSIHEREELVTFVEDLRPSNSAVRLRERVGSEWNCSRFSRLIKRITICLLRPTGESRAGFWKERQEEEEKERERQRRVRKQESKKRNKEE
jgi:hypothetical protein